MKFEKDASNFLERFRNKLEELERDRSTHLSYFDTYPWPPEEYHARQKTENPATRESHEYAKLHGNTRSTPRIAPDGPSDCSPMSPDVSSSVSNASQQQAAQERRSSTGSPTQADLDRAELFGLAPIKRSPRPIKEHIKSQPSKEKFVYDASPTAEHKEAPIRSLEKQRISSEDNTRNDAPHAEGGNSPLVNEATTSKNLLPIVLTEMEISQREAALESINQACHTFSEQSLKALQRIRSILGSYSEQLGDSTSALVTCEFIEAIVTKFEEEINTPEFWDMTKQDLMNKSISTNFDNQIAGILSEFRNAFTLEILKIVLDILRESLSEAEAEEHNISARPQWAIIMEFFEWKAGYTLQDCLSDCANIWSERFPPLE